MFSNQKHEGTSVLLASCYYTIYLGNKSECDISKGEIDGRQGLEVNGMLLADCTTTICP